MLRCEECHAVADDAAEGWEGHLAYGPREDDAAYAVFYCPTCATHEFGNLQRTILPPHATGCRLRD